MNTQRLYRSRTNKVFGGVCGGFAEYFDVDPVIIRILFVLMVLFGGSGILLYIAALVIIPKRPYLPPDMTAAAPAVSAAPSTAKNWLGYFLVAGGLLLLLSNLELLQVDELFDIAFEYLFPVVLIILGMGIIYFRQSASAPASGEGAAPSEGAGAAASDAAPVRPRQFRRSFRDKKLAGVCGGLAEYFGIDPSIMRLLYVVLCLASFGAALVLYVILALTVPYDYTLRTP